MNVTVFFSAIGVILAAIFIFFQPLHVKSMSTDELASIELDDFAVYKMTPVTLETVLQGRHAKRYSDRYVVTDINLTDYAQGYRQNMLAAQGVYRAAVTTLEGDVRYAREDGVRFACDKARYDESSTEVRSIGPFRLSQNRDTIHGMDVIYNSTSGKISAEKVEGLYTVKEHL